MPATNLIHNLIVEASIQNPDVPLDYIICDILFVELGHGVEARHAYNQEHDAPKYKIRNLDTQNAILSAVTDIPDGIAIWEKEKDNLTSLIAKAKIKRAKDLQDLAAQPAKFKLYNKLVDQFKFPISNAIDLAEKLSTKQIVALEKINSNQMIALEDLINQIMFHSVPMNCNTFATAIMPPKQTYETAINEIVRLLNGEHATLQVYTTSDSFYFEPKAPMQRRLTVRDGAALLKTNGITMDHLSFIAPQVRDKLMTELRERHDYYLLHSQDSNRYAYEIRYKRFLDIPVDQAAKLNKAKDAAIQAFVDNGIECPAYAFNIDEITNPNDFAKLFRSENEFASYIDEKVLELQQFVIKKISERVIKQLAESNDNLEELVAMDKDRKLLSVSSTDNLQTNAASPRYASPFSSAVRMLTSVINYVNTAEMQNILSNATISYFTMYSITSIASNQFGFFAVSGNATPDLLEAACNQTTLRF